MLQTIGTFEYVGLDADTLQSVFSNTCEIGEVNSVTEIADGVNTTALLHTSTGDYFVKLQSFNRDEVDVFSSQPFLLQYLQENDVPFKTATPVAYDYTQDDVRFRWYMNKAIEGEPFDTGANPITEEKARTVGRILGQINSIETPGYGTPSAPTTNTASCDVDAVLPFDESTNWEDAFKDSVMELVGTMDSQFYDLYDDIESYVENVDLRKPTPQLLHFDYWWENILWTDDDEPYVIDWERALSGDPLSNRTLSEHYLFDTVVIESDLYDDNFYPEDRVALQEAFREAYDAAYTGTTPLTADAETTEMYELLPYLRELRGFPYWWRNETDAFKEKRAEALRSQVTDFL